LSGSFIHLYITRFIFKYTLEKFEERIKNEQFSDTGNIGYTRQSTKRNKAKNTTQKTK